jgi:hypothetical protein
VLADITDPEETKWVRPPTWPRFGIVQEGDPILRQIATALDLPTEAEEAERLVTRLHAALDRAAAVHNFVSGLGLAAPQLRAGLAIATLAVRYQHITSAVRDDVAKRLGGLIWDTESPPDEEDDGRLVHGYRRSFPEAAHWRLAGHAGRMTMSA